MQPNTPADDQRKEQDSIPVPQDLADAGSSTSVPRTNDSPESLDEDLSNGSDREHVDPHHSITRPDQPVIAPGNDASMPETDNDSEMQEGESLIPKQAEDNATPFSSPLSPADDSAAVAGDPSDQGPLDPTHQATDSATNIDSHEQYDEGLSCAAEAGEPNAGNQVESYDPDSDQRKRSAP